MSQLPVVLLETSDVARALGLSYSGVRELWKKHVLEPVARTRRGVRLYRPEDVEVLRKARSR